MRASGLLAIYFYVTAFFFFSAGMNVYLRRRAETTFFIYFDGNEDLFYGEHNRKVFVSMEIFIRDKRDNMFCVNSGRSKQHWYEDNILTIGKAMA